MGYSKKVKDEDDGKNAAIEISTWLPSIWDLEQAIVKLDKGNVASENMVNSILKVEEKGEELLQEFISRFTSENSELKYSDSIKRHQVYTLEMPRQKDTNHSMTEGEKESFRSILSIFESQKLNLKYITNWPVTNKPWAICNAPGKRQSNSKPLFGNSLLGLCSSQPETSAPQSIECCIVDTMRVVRIIPISDVDENTFMCWTKRFVNYLKLFSGQVIHVIFSSYEKSEEVRVCKWRSQKGKESNITNLNETRPKLRNWENILVM